MCLVYYKSMNMYILIFNCSEKESFEKIKEHFIHLKAVCKNKDPNILLIGMHFSPKHKIVINILKKK